jgi:hypothetical protein
MRTSFHAAFIAFTAAALAAALSGSASAVVYKCAEEGNKSIYQDSPCPPGKELRNFDTDPAEVSVIPFRAVPDTMTVPVAPGAAKPPPASKVDRKKETSSGADAAQRRFIVSGMSEGQVLAKIGSPDMSSGDRGRKSTRWSYLPAAGDPQTITTIVFDYGKVVDVERRIMH